MTTPSQHLIQMLTGVRVVPAAAVGGVSIDARVPGEPAPATPPSAVINGMVNTPLVNALIDAAFGRYEVGPPEPFGTFEVGPPEYPGPGEPGLAETGVTAVLPWGVGINAAEFIDPGLPYPIGAATARIDAASGFYVVENYPPEPTARISGVEPSWYPVVVINAASGVYEIDASGASYPGRAEVGLIGPQSNRAVLAPDPSVWRDLIEIGTADECRLDRLVIGRAVLA